MITAAQKRKIIKHLGKNYAPLILERLEALGIRNQNGEPYKADSIYKVMNGRHTSNVEVVIFQLSIEKKAEMDALKKQL